jgi:hypothetical protein
MKALLTWHIENPGYALSFFHRTPEPNLTQTHQSCFNVETRLMLQDQRGKNNERMLPRGAR